MESLSKPFVCISVYYLQRYAVLPDFNVYGKELKYFFALVTSIIIVDFIIAKCVSCASSKKKNERELIWNIGKKQSSLFTKQN